MLFIFMYIRNSQRHGPRPTVGVVSTLNTPNTLHVIPRKNRIHSSFRGTTSSRQRDQLAVASR